jgi:hypothetical protein
MRNSVNILGTEYEIGSLEDTNQGQMCDGIMQEYAKRILIKPKDKMLSEQDSEEDKQKRFNEVLRHEIMHCYFTESGLNAYSDDEVLIDWFAKQCPKILKSFIENECEG